MVARFIPEKRRPNDDIFKKAPLLWSQKTHSLKEVIFVFVMFGTVKA